MECVTGLLESPLVCSPLVHAKLVELLTYMLRSDVHGQGTAASRALSLAVLGALLHRAHIIKESLVVYSY